jgi:monoamine oxidase
MNSTPPIVDVAIVGAGISGLQAARLLQKNGRGVIVLEARNRVGGKTLTSDRVSSGKGIRQEYGAAWINDTTQSRIWALAKEFNLTPIVQAAGGRVVAQDLDGNCLFFEYGSVPAVGSKIRSCVAMSCWLRGIVQS